MTRITLLLGILSAVVGCSGGRPESEVERGKQAVVAALESWKAKEPAAKLKSLPEPIEFTDELRATHALVGYSLGNVDGSDKDVVRYTVTLTLKDRRGKESSREVVFAVALKNPIVIARDPYY
jgi:hypothetical protein